MDDTKLLLSFTVNYSSLARVLEKVLIPIYNGYAAGVSIIAWCLIPIRRDWLLLKAIFKGLYTINKPGKPEWIVEYKFIVWFKL